MLLEILSFWKCPSISVSEEQLLQKNFGNVSVKQPWWSPFPVYFLACLTLPQEFSEIIKVTSRQLIKILSVIKFDPRQHWFTGNFLNILERVFLDDTNACDRAFGRF